MLPRSEVDGLAHLGRGCGCCVEVSMQRCFAQAHHLRRADPRQTLQAARHVSLINVTSRGSNVRRPVAETKAIQRGLALHDRRHRFRAVTAGVAKQARQVAPADPDLVRKTLDAELARGALDLQQRCPDGVTWRHGDRIFGQRMRPAIHQIRPQAPGSTVAEHIGQVEHLVPDLIWIYPQQGTSCPRWQPQDAKVRYPCCGDQNRPGTWANDVKSRHLGCGRAGHQFERITQIDHDVDRQRRQHSHRTGRWPHLRMLLAPQLHSSRRNTGTVNDGVTVRSQRPVNAPWTPVSGKGRGRIVSAIYLRARRAQPKTQRIDIDGCPGPGLRLVE